MIHEAVNNVLVLDVLFYFCDVLFYHCTVSVILVGVN